MPQNTSIITLKQRAVEIRLQFFAVKYGIHFPSVEMFAPAHL